MTTIYTCDGCGGLIDRTAGTSQLRTPSFASESDPWNTTKLIFHSLDCLQRWLKAEMECKQDSDVTRVNLLFGDHQVATFYATDGTATPVGQALT